ncbi:NAD(P)-dependent oxidoreductase [Thiomicrorhabdus sp. Milos-T2]|uniref:NAD-dependent epimerase/dehydratase family protein n=1 Tax=Thiomicrorhabdus sp. Milos-T2 TaxID=90814 RepID=UPI0004948FCA|nr:NAD(P)-dependent oxidoreductase [Thiomicrorhabdus sp. Milos-T2]
MKVILFGSSGFVGKALLDVLVVHDHLSITCVTRNKDNTSLRTQTNLSYIECDLLNPKIDFRSLISGYDFIINCVGEVVDEDLMESVNYKLVQSLVDCIVNNNLKIRLIQLSSVGCYGAVEESHGHKTMITEESQLVPHGMYEVTKARADIYIQKRLDGLDCDGSYTIIRPTIVFGPDMKNNSLRQLGVLVKKGVFFYTGKQNSIVNYIHVEDVAQSILLCIQKKLESKNQVFIVSNDCSQKELINGIADCFKVKKPFIRFPRRFVFFITKILEKFSPSFPLTQSRVRYLSSQIHYSNSKIQKQLDFYPAKNVEDHICQVYEK